VLTVDNHLEMRKWAIAELYTHHKRPIENLQHRETPREESYPHQIIHIVKQRQAA
jgi:hypothetical protein